MRQLPPEVKSQFMQGAFAVNLSGVHFKCVWIDYALETTENKDLEDVGGIIGLTMKRDGLLKWFLARSATTLYSNQFL